jgi:hypothetical protein
MSEFCSLTSGYTCRKDIQEGNNLKLKECACLLDEHTLREQFCQPGNSLPECEEQNALQEFIPVTCFGKNCGAGGYRFGRMLNQTCNVTMCQQIVDVVGDNIVVDSTSILYCGTKPLASSYPSVSPTVSPSPIASETGVWVWLLIGVGFFLVVVVVPLALILYKRSYKTETLDNTRRTERIEKGINTFGVKNVLALSNKN